VFVTDWLKTIWNWLFGGKDEPKDDIIVKAKREPIEPLKLKYEVELKDKVHEIMAIRLSRIARLYPSNFDNIKVVLMEYISLVEQVLIFRETGNPESFFNKLQDFVDINMRPFLKKEPTDTQLEVNKLISDGFITLEEIIARHEGKLPIESEDVVETNKSEDFEVDWTERIEEIKKTQKLKGRPSEQEKLSPNDPIEKIKGVGEKKAKELRARGITTVSEYWDYIQEQENGNNEQ
jgi:hypothetical protein